MPRCTAHTTAGLAFLEQIGYSLGDADVTQVGVLMVIRDPATLAASKGKFKKGYFGPFTVRKSGARPPGGAAPVCARGPRARRPAGGA